MSFKGYAHDLVELPSLSFMCVCMCECMDVCVHVLVYACERVCAVCTKCVRVCACVCMGGIHFLSSSDFFFCLFLSSESSLYVSFINLLLKILFSYIQALFSFYGIDILAAYMSVCHILSPEARRGH